jgi:xanthine/CO dehydrogenase XdhC/CoxF family maturation factor
LDLGGDTPASVALAIVGEITAYLNERSGGMLKYRKTTIHEASEASHSPVVDGLPAKMEA